MLPSTQPLIIINNQYRHHYHYVHDSGTLASSKHIFYVKWTLLKARSPEFSLGLCPWTFSSYNLNNFCRCVKRKTNLMPLILLFIQYSFIAQHVSAVNTTIFRSVRLTGCYFMGGIWFGVCWRQVGFSLCATIKMMHGPINIKIFVGILLFSVLGCTHFINIFHNGSFSCLLYSNTTMPPKWLFIQLMQASFHLETNTHCSIWEILVKREFSEQNFEKYSNIKFHENPSSWSRVTPCGWKDRQTWRSCHFSLFCERS